MLFLLLAVAVLSGCVPQQPQGPAVSILSIQPESVEHGGTITVTWRVEGANATIPHTALHYGSASHPGVLTTDVTPQDAKYDQLTVPKQGAIPATFTDEIVAGESSNLYVRAHAIIAGKNYWTAEYRVPVIPSSMKTVEKQKVVKETPAPQPVVTSDVKAFTIEADDRGLYPDTVQVMKGDKVTLTFKVRTDNVYYGGLDFRSPLFNTGKIAPGAAMSVDFVADQSFVFSSYWPAAGVKKADGNVVVS